MTLPLYGMNFLHNLAGKRTRIKYFTSTIGSVWDDEVAWRQSGNALWLDAIEMCLDDGRDSDDALLQEQGKLGEGDKKMFIIGSVTLQTGSSAAKIQIGSPTGDNYFIIPAGAKIASWGNTDVFKKVYIRKLTNGSLYGETDI